MAEIGSAFVSIMPSAKGFGTSLGRQVNPQVSRAGVGIGAGLGKSMLKGFIAIGAGIKIAQFLGDSLGEAREANAVAALTENVIKTTGGAAKVSAAQVERLADSLSRKTGIDDEQIASAENLILTFKNVTREGEGVENIFGRATRAAVDLSASGFGDTAGTAKMLGKALNDPVKGITALSRAGVTFTDEQKEQIKTLVESGKGFKAQKIILREVESQVKGAAEAQATNADKARVAMGNLKEQIGQALIPAVDALAGLFANKIAPAISTFITNLQSGKGKAGELGNFIRGTVVPALSDLWDWVQNRLVPALRDGLGHVLENATRAFNKIRDAVGDNKPELQQLWSAFKRVMNFIVSTVMPKVMALSSTILPALADGIGIIIDVAAFWVRAFRKVKEIFETVKGAIQNVIGSVKAMASAVRSKVDEIVGKVKTMGSKVWTPIRQGAARVKEVVMGAFNAISGAIQGAIDKAVTLISKLREIAGMDKGSAVKGKSGRTAAGAGGAVGQGVAEGLIDGTKGGLYDAQNGLDKVIDGFGKRTGKKLKEQLAKIRGQLATVRSDFASLVEPIASNFTNGLFDFDTAGAFTANLSTVKGTLTTLMANFRTLISEGLNPGFLYKLFQEGGPALINSLAGLPKSEALAAGGLFGDVMSLSDQLGTAVAGSTDKGAALENQTARLERKLDKLTNSVDRQAVRIGQEINGAASNGRRRG